MSIDRLRVSLAAFLTRCARRLIGKEIAAAERRTLTADDLVRLAQSYRSECGQFPSAIRIAPATFDLLAAQLDPLRVAAISSLSLNIDDGKVKLVTDVRCPPDTAYIV